MQPVQQAQVIGQQPQKTVKNLKVESGTLDLCEEPGRQANLQPSLPLQHLFFYDLSCLFEELQAYKSLVVVDWTEQLGHNQNNIKGTLPTCTRFVRNRTRPCFASNVCCPKFEGPYCRLLHVGGTNLIPVII